MNNVEKNYIKSFIQIDDLIKKNETHLKKLRQKKKKVSENIIKFIESKNIQNLDIQIGKSKIRYTEKTSKSGYSQQFMKENLKKYFKIKYAHFNDNKCEIIANDILTFLNQSRKETTKISLKRIDSK